jgi:membrane-bound serine protease (ClpP class)
MMHLMIALIILIVGLLIIAVEVFLIPGFGVTGILGTMMVMSGIIYLWKLFGALYGFIAIAGSAGVIGLFIYFFPRFKTTKKLILDASEKGTEFSQSTEAYENLIGKEGMVIGHLRPSGIIEIEGNRYDAISDGDFIHKNQKIIVTSISGNKIMVKLK